MTSILDTEFGHSEMLKLDVAYKRIAELEAREEAEAKKIWEQLQRIEELEAALEEIERRFVNMKQGESPYIVFQNAVLFARRALERKP
jgi:hypothetical protein